MSPRSLTASIPAGPLRSLCAGTLVSSVGTGAWYTTWALFLTRSVGLAPAQVGLGMTLAGALSVVAGGPCGALADRLGARDVYATLLAIQALAYAGYLGVGSFAAFAVCACVAECARGGSGGPRNALVLALVPADERLRALAAMRSTSHVGWAIGAGAGAVCVAVDSAAGYHAAIALNGLSYAGYALLVRSLPRVGSPRRQHERRVRLALRDGPYFTLAGLTGTLALCWAMLSSGLPLWIALHTRAPHDVAAVIVIVNSLGIALLQTRVSRLAPTPRIAVRVAVGSGSALAASCLLLAATDGGHGAAVVVVMLIAGIVHLAGELLFVAASWGLSVPLMPSGAPGEYQGVFSTGEEITLMLAPALMTTLVGSWGRPGW
ncbi:MAG: MFS transporter, partial [Solirubrobacteraceae bacterium]